MSRVQRITEQKGERAARRAPSLTDPGGTTNCYSAVRNAHRQGLNLGQDGMARSVLVRVLKAEQPDASLRGRAVQHPHQFGIRSMMRGALCA